MNVDTVHTQAIQEMILHEPVVAMRSSTAGNVMRLKAAKIEQCCILEASTLTNPQTAVFRSHDVMNIHAGINARRGAQSESALDGARLVYLHQRELSLK